MKQTMMLTALLAAILSPSIQAEDKALLIGVGKYKNPKYNLPGIDLDLGMMKKTADLLGFDQVKVIKNEQTTLNNVTRTIENYLIKGTVADDRVLIYFSGHGTRIPDTNGDETDDGADEVLTMHELAIDYVDGRPSVTGVLVDDDFNTLLNRIPSKNVLVLVDACNSGTVTKSIISDSVLGAGLETVSKYIEYDGMPAVSKGNFMSSNTAADANFAAISAAGDTESAQATKKGSLFTLGLSEAIKNSVSTDTPLTIAALKNKTETYIKKENKQQPFTPRLSGNAALQQKVLTVRSRTVKEGPRWTQLLALIKKASPLSVSLNQKRYALGDKLTIKIDPQQSGYLNVVNINAQDEPVVLFPNKFHSNNHVTGSITIPTAQMGFDFNTQPPNGPSLIVALLTEKALDLYKGGTNSAGSKGTFEEEFHMLSQLEIQQLTRNFAVQKKENSTAKVWAGKVVTEVCGQSCQ